MSQREKGFVFVETIVVCTVLLTILVTIYASFVLIINTQKKRSDYNQSRFNYRAYNIIKTLDNVGCDDTDTVDIDSNVKELFELEDVLVGNASDLRKKSVDPDFKEYLSTIAENNQCIYAFKFENGDKYAYTYVKIQES